MKKIIVLLAITILLGACQPTPEQLAAPLAQTLTAYPTNTPYPTYTPENTQTPNPTYTIAPTYTPWIKLVTATPTATPKFTETITPTPTETFTITPTQDPLTTDKRPGFYLVGEDIAPGVWRSLGTNDDCYWQVSTKTGDIISNHFGMSGGTMYIPASAYQVELQEECGKWVYLGQ